MKTQLINFTIPKSLLKQVDSVAKKSSRSRSSLLREGARLIAKRAKQRKNDFFLIRQSAKEVNLSEEEAVLLIDKIRDELQINT